MTNATNPRPPFPFNQATQRDGSFSDVLENPRHKQHPTTGFVYPEEECAEELPEVALLNVLRAAVKVLTVCGLEAGFQDEQLRKAWAALGDYLGVPRAEDSSAPETAAPGLTMNQEIEDFILRPDADGMADQNAYSVAIRYLVTRWFARPALFGDASQKEFGILLRRKTELRCPNCAARKKEIGEALNRPSPAFRLREYRGHWLDESFLKAEWKSIDPRFETADMKKQSPNRIITEFRDRFGVQNGQMRQARGRENMAAAHAKLKEAA